MRRGDLVTVAMQGDFGKPRPALVIQADQFGGIPTVTLLPLSSDRMDASLLRIDIAPDARNGLRKPSQVMVDKAYTARREKIGRLIGTLNAETMLRVERSLAVFLGIAK